MFEPTYSGYGGRPYNSEFEAAVSGATKSPSQCQDDYGVYKTEYDQAVAKWNREHPNDKH